MQIVWSLPKQHWCLMHVLGSFCMLMLGKLLLGTLHVLGVLDCGLLLSAVDNADAAGIASAIGAIAGGVATSTGANAAVGPDDGSGGGSNVSRDAHTGGKGSGIWPNPFDGAWHARHTPDGPAMYPPGTGSEYNVPTLDGMSRFGQQLHDWAVDVAGPGIQDSTELFSATSKA